VLNRAAVLVLSSEQQLAVDPGNQYIRNNIAHEWEISTPRLPCHSH